MIALILMGLGLGGIFYGSREKVRSQSGRPRQSVAYSAKRSMRVKNSWAQPGTIAAHATGPTQPAQTGPTQSAHTYSKEIDILNTRAKTTQSPEWRMRFKRALARAAGQLARNASQTRAGNVPYSLPDRFDPNIAPPTDAQPQNEPASRATRVAASYQVRFRHPGMLQGQPIQKHSKGTGVANRPVDREENPARLRTVRGKWRQVNYR